MSFDVGDCYEKIFNILGATPTKEQEDAILRVLQNTVDEAEEAGHDEGYEAGLDDGRSEAEEQEFPNVSADTLRQLTDGLRLLASDPSAASIYLDRALRDFGENGFHNGRML
jgi:hypothetical protein